jgi:hypothetical protein
VNVDRNGHEVEDDQQEKHGDQPQHGSILTFRDRERLFACLLKHLFEIDGRLLGTAARYFRPFA